MGSAARLLTFGDPSIQSPGVEAVIKINSRQTVASFPGLSEFSLLGEGQRTKVRSGISDQPCYDKLSNGESPGARSVAGH